MNERICKDCHANATHYGAELGPCPRCGSCCECYCTDIPDTNRACGHHLSALCSGCRVCTECDGCYCHEEDW